MSDRPSLPGNTRYSIGQKRHPDPGLAAEQCGPLNRSRTVTIPNLVEGSIKLSARAAVERQRLLDGIG